MRWSGLNGPFASHHSPASLAKRATSSRSRLRFVSAIGDERPFQPRLVKPRPINFSQPGEGRLRHAVSVSMKAASPAGPLNGSALLLWAFGPEERGPVRKEAMALLVLK